MSLDGGVLGVLGRGGRRPRASWPGRRPPDPRRKPIEDVEGFDQWTAPAIRIDSDDATVLAGVDGEAMELPAPLDIRSCREDCGCIVPVGTPDAPGAARRALLSREAIGNLVEIAGGVAPGPFGDDS